MRSPDDDPQQPRSIWLARVFGHDSPLARLSREIDPVEIARAIEGEAAAQAEEQAMPFTASNLKDLSDIILD